MRSRVVVLLAVALVAAGCAADEPKPVLAPPLEVTDTGEPAYDESLEPAAAVLALVPASATVLTVTDFDELRLQLGVSDLTSAAPAGQRRTFEREVATETAALSPGLLRDDEQTLLSRYGFSQDDVAWEATFSGPDGEGWVLRFRDDLDLGGVSDAVDDGVGPLSGADVYPTTQIVGSGITTDPTASWRADDTLVGLVGQVAGATYVDRSCLPFDVAFGAGLEDQLAATLAADLDDLDELGPFSVSFGSVLATVQLGPGRPDVFDRARLGDTMPATDPEFGLGFAKPVADPQGGRIGYDIGDPVVAARLVREQHLPFAVCAD